MLKYHFDNMFWSWNSGNFARGYDALVAHVDVVTLQVNVAQLD